MNDEEKFFLERRDGKYLIGIEGNDVHWSTNLKMAERATKEEWTHCCKKYKLGSIKKYNLVSSNEIPSDQEIDYFEKVVKSFTDAVKQRDRKTILAATEEITEMAERYQRKANV